MDPFGFRRHVLAQAAFAPLLAGVTIVPLIVGAMVELIARGVVGGALAERTGRRIIEDLRDHVITCGCGCDRLRPGDVVIAMGSPVRIGRLEDAFVRAEPVA